jgi:hypothetical protein
MPEELFKVSPRERSPDSGISVALRPLGLSVGVLRAYAVRMLETVVIGLMWAVRSGRAAILVIKTTSVSLQVSGYCHGRSALSLAAGGYVE